MAQFGSNDVVGDAPKFVTNAATGQTGTQEYGTAVFGVSAGEAGANNLTSGWVRRVAGTGGRSGRVDIEVIAALSGKTAFLGADAADDAVIPDPTISVGTAPAPTTVTDPESATFTVVATTTGAGELTYQWEVSTDGGNNWADTVDADGTGATLTVASGDAEYVTLNQFRVTVSTNGAVDVTTAPVVLTINP